MNRRINVLLAVVSIMAMVGLGMVAAWGYDGGTQATNVPAAFQKPLVRDLKLVNDLNALTKRVETLEEKIKQLEARGVRGR